MSIPIRTAIAIRGDFWTLQLSPHDPRGHRTCFADVPDQREVSAARRYRAARERGATIAEAAAFLDN